ncbi:STAS-like domain-containing protein [Lacrimispora sp.]|uniref:STAS-like domain-containing protein n=1 Tax=Lacrimispora sp. TaxID=2719234 RepID=UPI0028A73176|nr:STAS-like domain-containing protein [Lacrimispora sp.]
MLISIANDFSKTPGARNEKEGPNSGEKFRENILIPKYYEAEKKGERLVVDLDGCYGFATSFLEESFGGMVRKLKRKGILDNIEIISNDDDTSEDLIKKYVKKAEDKL